MLFFSYFDAFLGKTSLTHGVFGKVIVSWKMVLYSYIMYSLWTHTQVDFNIIVGQLLSWLYFWKGGLWIFKLGLFSFVLFPHSYEKCLHMCHKERNTIVVVVLKALNINIWLRSGEGELVGDVSGCSSVSK